MAFIVIITQNKRNHQGKLLLASSLGTAAFLSFHGGNWGPQLVLNRDINGSKAIYSWHFKRYLPMVLSSFT